MASAVPAGGPDDASPSSEMSGLEVRDGAPPRTESGDVATELTEGAEGMQSRYDGAGVLCTRCVHVHRAFCGVSSPLKICAQSQAQQLQDAPLHEVATARRVLLWQPMQLCARQ